ncbi:DUF5689 domain-containing protein [Seonamhaeicola sp.]|uniref:T9SS type A sorting domain-containing protein n=1 Tax=Seonamhaeicola sp. TaxID=1912245 RepID=UPI00356706A6
MKKLYFLFSVLLISSASFGQIVINEVDSDTPGTDTAEFIELLWTPNTALDGYVVVLFNGGGDDLSYAAYDLDGYSTDSNGFFVIGSTGMGTGIEVSPGSSGWLQNGADAIAVYQASDTDFPNDTAITLTNLIDAFVYDTDDSDDSGLLTGFGESIQYNENANGAKDTQSLQRQSDGSYEALSPTMGATNNSPSAAIQVADLAALRADVIANGAGSTYELLSTPTVTYSRSSRNQKYIQDGTAGILIDDNSGTITETYADGDGISNLVGTASEYLGVLQFIPSQDATKVASTAVTPETVTISTLLTDWEDYESELIKITGVTFTDAGSTFASSTDYDISDGSTINFRTNFSEVNYIGETIPSGSNDIVVLVSEYNGTPQVVARSLSDFTLDSKTFEISNFEMYPNPTDLGYINISSRSSSAMSVTVFDLLGKQLINKTLSNKTLDVSNLNTGVYLLKVAQDNATITKRLVIK